ncbi:MAG: 16S rRNA (guanine(527)-N(7))-methyltransferase RsmG [Nostocoides sp.]
MADTSPTLDGFTELTPEAIPSAPAEAEAIFGAALPLARTYAELLADTGVTHGLIGPREVPRLWERHLMNCAVISDSFADDEKVIDVGSGAGLPGLVLAIVRPDLDMHLVEPMLRRTTWLQEAVSALRLENVTVHRGRAEDFAGSLKAPAVTARAVARLDKLALWAVPLLANPGRMIAMKGASAETELNQTRPALRRLGLVDARVSGHGEAWLDPPVRSVDLFFGQAP